MFQRLTLALALFLAAPLAGAQAQGTPPPMPELKTIQAGDLELAYFEEGEGPLVVLVHGFPDTPYTWVDVRPALAEAGYRVVTPYLRGYAPSGIPEDRSIVTSEDIGQDILNLIEALGEEEAYVLGHDWGASAAYASATLDPEVVTKLVTVAIPHPEALEPSLGLLWKGRHFVYLSGRRGVRKMQRRDQQHVDVLYHRWAPNFEVPEWQLNAVKASYSNQANLETALAYYASTRVESDFFETPIATDTFSICGAEDLVGPKEFESARQYFTGDYSFECVPGGHWPHRESPEEFIELVLAFFKGEREVTQ